MLRLVPASGLLAGVLLLLSLSSWGACAPGETGAEEDQALGNTVVTLNESCREQVLQRIRASVLRSLRLDRTPRFPVETTAPWRQAWAKETAALFAPSAGGQPLEIASNQTVLIRRGRCTQVSHRVTLADLGWQSWVLHPPSFLFTECLGCQCRPKDEGPSLALWVRECTPETPNLRADRGPEQRRCCRPRRTPLSFVFLQEDGSLTVQAVPPTPSCRCQP